MSFSTIVTLSMWSNGLLVAAMALYSAAFVLFAVDLARRSGRTGAVSDRRSAAGATRRRAAAGELEGAAAGSATGALGTAPDPLTDAPGHDDIDRGLRETGEYSGGTGGHGAPRASDAADGAAPRVMRALGRTKAHEADGWRDTTATGALRVAMGFTYLAFVAHLAATTVRGIAAERVPWANMFEFSMTFTLLIVAVFLVSRFWADLRFLGTFITGFAALWLILAMMNFYVDVVPLVPALQSAWLVIHVGVSSIGTGCFAMGFGLSLLQLLQQRRAARSLAGQSTRMRFLHALPKADRLEDLAYRINVVGFIMWTFTLVFGSIWAELAWGRYWGWDTKEVWTFIVWVVYAGYIHARATRGWRGTPSAWLSMVGFATVIFNFAIVNVFFDGLHAYSGL